MPVDLLKQRNKDLSQQQRQGVDLLSSPEFQGVTQYTGGQPNTDIPRTVLDNALQGLTFNLGDEITSGLAAPFVAGATDDRFGDGLGNTIDAVKDAYIGGQNLSERDLDAQLEENPVTSIASQLGGSLITGGAGASTKAGSAVANSIKNSSNTGKAVKSAGVGGVLSGLYGAGSEEDDRLGGATDSAITGAALGAVTPAVSSAAGKIFSRKPKDVRNADELKTQAQKLYSTADELGGRLSPHFTNDFLTEINSLTPQTEVGKLVGGDSAFSKVVDTLSSIKDKPLDLKSAEELDNFLSQQVDEFVVNGKLNQQGKKLFDIQSTLRNMIDNAGEEMFEGGSEGFDAVKQGRALWSQSRKAGDIERIIQRAELSDNTASALKSGFRTLASNPSRLRGYKPDEIQAIKEAAESGVISDSIRTLGSRLIPIGSVLTGGNPGVTAAALAGTTAARSATGRIQTNKANKISEIISNGGVKPEPELLIPEVAGTPLVGANVADLFTQYYTNR